MSFDELLGIDVARLLNPIGCGQRVFKIAATHVFEVRFLELLPVSRRPAIVGRNNEIPLIDHVLYDAVEGVHRLRRRSAVDIDDGRVLGVARQVVGHVDEGRNLPFAVAAGIADELRLDHVVAPDACNEGVGDSDGLARGHIGGCCFVNPQIIRSLGAVVVVEHLVAVVRERCRRAPG